MDHDKSRSRVRKDLYIAPLVIALVMAVIVGVIIARQPPTPEPKLPEKPAANLAAAKPAPAPRVKLPLMRTELLDAARRAASDYAVGNRPAAASGRADLKGRRFSLRIPFACNGANGVMLNPQAAVSYDPGRSSITITAQPGIWASLPVMVPFVESSKAEAVEGFWLPRPWTMSEECPKSSSDLLPAISTPITAQTVGLAQIFPPGGARTQRHDEHPYSITRKLAPADTDLLNHSYFLLLEGTVTGYPDGQPLHCWSESPEHHPICIFAVTFDRVAFQDAQSGQVLASWSD